MPPGLPLPCRFATCPCCPLHTTQDRPRCCGRCTEEVVCGGRMDRGPEAKTPANPRGPSTARMLAADCVKRLVGRPVPPSPDSPRLARSDAIEAITAPWACQAFQLTINPALESSQLRLGQDLRITLNRSSRRVSVPRTLGDPAPPVLPSPHGPRLRPPPPTLAPAAAANPGARRRPVAREPSLGRLLLS
jgi:hypothetical protein